MLKLIVRLLYGGNKINTHSRASLLELLKKINKKIFVCRFVILLVKTSCYMPPKYVPYAVLIQNHLKKLYKICMSRSFEY